MTDPELVAKRLAIILVHGYDAVDLAIVQDVVEHHLDELLQFADTVRKRLGG